MALETFVSLGNALYVPFLQDVRGGKEGKAPVGTVSAHHTDTGDASGGTMTLTFQMERIQFGFRSIIVPTLLVTSDNLSTAEAVRLQYRNAGNRRIGEDYNQASLSVAGSAGNFAKFDESGLILENDVIGVTSALSFIWSTNTNTIVYFARVFAAVFDAEVIEAQGNISDFLAGVR